MPEINGNGDFSIDDLVEYLADQEAGVGHSELLTVCTSTQRIILQIAVVSIEDITPKLKLVK
jgi:hypothetical protein